MGILRVKDDQRPIRVEEITYADYVFDDTDDEENSEDEVQETHVPSTPSRRRRQRVGRSVNKICGFADLECLAAGVKIKRRMGSRKLRRLENARYMCALADPNDICDDFSDILPETVSAFAQLFIDHSKMKAWNEFIEKDEEEQLAFLGENKSEKKNDDVNGGGYYLGRSPGRNNNNVPEKIQADEDSRNHHPAYSAAACFARLDVRFQTLFVQRRLPWDFMKNIEDALRTFFLGEVPPGGEWTSLPTPSALHRLIVHGISQYLALQSTSVANGDEEKFVKVCNVRPFFIPPHKHLVSYLKHRHRAGK